MPPEMHGPPFDVLTYIHPRSGNQHPLLREGIKNIAGPWTKIENLHRRFDLDGVFREHPWGGTIMERTLTRKTDAPSPWKPRRLSLKLTLKSGIISLIFRDFWDYPQMLK